MVSTDGSSVIQLYYDRDVHYIYYQMNGGNVRDPVPLRFGQQIPESVQETPIRQGYTFTGNWTWLNGEGAEIDALGIMPDGDLTLSANWVGADATVTLVYWQENANDDNYTRTGSRTITVPTEAVVAQEVSGGAYTGKVDVPLAQYTTADQMKEAGINDGEYFTFIYADSSTQYALGALGGPQGCRRRRQHSHQPGLSAQRVHPGVPFGKKRVRRNRNRNENGI